MSRPGVSSARAQARYRAQREIEKVAAVAQAAADFAAQVLETRLKLLSMRDGEDATDMLARLAVVIGSPCQAGAAVYGHETAPPWVKQLHGALRTVQFMCLHGYHWRAEFALAMDRAVELATQPRPDLTPQAFHAAYLDACHLGNLIHGHEVAPNSVNDH